VVLPPGLSESDAAYLADLAREVSIRCITLTDPSQDLLADLRRDSRHLTVGDALVIVDQIGATVGAQTRQAADDLLCERTDLWLEYRRFADHASCLTVIRGGAMGRTPAPSEADIAKWEPSHKAVADSLAPLIVSYLHPRSAIDIGCGAGYWLNALAAHGVATTRGVSPRIGRDAAMGAGDVRYTSLVAPLDAIPDCDQRFDVCLCLEVAQRLAPDAQERLIDACARLSDVVVFSSTPPGVAGSSPHDRPLPYWAARFWRHGYVLDGGLRRLIGHRWSAPRTVFDGMVVFRRTFTAAQAGEQSEAGRALGAFVLASAKDAHDAWTQSVWWSVLAGDRQSVPAPVSPEAPRSRVTSWTIPAARLTAAPAPLRVFRFRADASRWYVTHPGANIEVLEDGRPLTEVPTRDDLAAVAGGWTRWRDEITIKASDASDPRHNRRHYALVLPSYVAWGESQPLLDYSHRVA
jgi:hypothetical protein